MRQYIRRLAFAATLPLLLAGCGGPTTPPQPGSVSVTGTAEIHAVPDEFVIHASASEHGKAIKPISAAVNRRIDKVIALIEKQGVDKKAITALEQRVVPQWQSQPTRKQIGYQASRNLTIATHGAQQYAQVMQILLNHGINYIGRTEARVSNAKTLKLNALAAAVKNARAKADKLAKAAGRDIARAQTISTAGGHSARPLMMRAMTAPKANTANYQPGEITLRQQVQVTFTLK